MRRRKSPKERAAALRLDHCGPTGKIRYRTESAAREQLKQFKRARGTDPGREERRAYRCWSCDGWHLTKQPYGEPRGDSANGSREMPPPTEETKATG